MRGCSKRPYWRRLNSKEGPFNPEMFVLIQKRPFYSGNPNSKTLGDSQNAILHWAAVLGPPSHQNAHQFFSCVQVWGSVQHKGVQALATLDEKLEQTPLLEELDPNEMPDEVTDSNGNMTQDCSEVWVWL